MLPENRGTISTCFLASKAPALGVGKRLLLGGGKETGTSTVEGRQVGGDDYVKPVRTSVKCEPKFRL